MGPNDKRPGQNGEGSTGPGVYGISDSGAGLYGESTTGPGGEFESAGDAGIVVIRESAGNTLQSVAQFIRAVAVGPAGDGIGGSLDLYVEDKDGAAPVAARLTASLVVSGAARESIVDLRACGGADTVGVTGLRIRSDGTTTTPSLPAYAPTPTSAGAEYEEACPPAWCKYPIPLSAVQALGEELQGEVDVCTLAAGHIVHRAMVSVLTAETALTTLTVSLGVVGTDFLDFVGAGDAQAVAVYGAADAELGASIASRVGYIATEPTVVKAQFIATDAALKLADAAGLTAAVYLLVSRI